jgi:hypothetical protein
MNGFSVEPGSKGSIRPMTLVDIADWRLLARHRISPRDGSSTTMSPPVASNRSTASARARSQMSCMT